MEKNQKCGKRRWADSKGKRYFFIQKPEILPFKV